MSTEPGSQETSVRPGWLVEDRPDLVVVRARGISAEIHGGWVVLIIAALVGIRFVAGAEMAAWLSLPAFFLWIPIAALMHAIRREEIRATPERLEFQRRSPFGNRHVVLTGRPEEVRPPGSLLAAVFFPHLVVEHAGRRYRFARSMNPEARAWLLSRLRHLWGLEQSIYPPPRETR